MAYILLLALALSIDTFVLAISIGLCMKTEKDFKPYKYCAVFGFVQAGLFALGRVLSTLIPSDLFGSDVNFHISSLVFLFLAIKMFIEYFKEEELVCLNLNDIWRIAVLTSIDALIVGFTPLKVSYHHGEVALAVLITTTIAAYLGIEMARRLKNINVIEKYSLLIGSALLLILAITSF